MLSLQSYKTLNGARSSSEATQSSCMTKRSSPGKLEFQGQRTGTSTAKGGLCPLAPTNLALSFEIASDTSLGLDIGGEAGPQAGSGGLAPYSWAGAAGVVPQAAGRGS